MSVIFDTSFTWNVGDTPLYYYRVLGKNISPHKEQGLEPNDPNCGGPLSEGDDPSQCGKRSFIEMVAARDLSDLCQKLKEKFLNYPLKWPIEAIHKFSRPVYKDDIEAQEAEGIDHSYNEMIPVDFSSILDCLDYGADEFLATETFITSELLYEDVVLSGFVGSGFLRLCGHVIFPADEFLETVVVASSEIVSSSLESVEPETQEMELDNDTVTKNCDCSPLEKAFIMGNNIATGNSLYYFLTRNGKDLFSSLYMIYNDVEGVWRYSNHYEDDYEKWNILMEWGCNNNDGDGPLVWRFTFQARRYDITTGTVSNTRLLFNFLASDTCNAYRTDYGFSINVKTHLITSNQLTSWGDYDIFSDEIGLFKTDYWTKNQELRIIMPINAFASLPGEFDISPAFPVQSIVEAI